jgi:hypothetical protein
MDSNSSNSTPTTFVLNIVDGASYDMALRQYKVRGRCIITCGVTAIPSIVSALRNKDCNSIFTEDYQNISMTGKAINLCHDEKKYDEMICNIIDQVGFKNTTVNFECCSGYGTCSNIVPTSVPASVPVPVPVPVPAEAAQHPQLTICDAISADKECLPCVVTGCNSSSSCKDNKHYDFLNTSYSKIAIEFIVYMLQNGSQVICTDFAAKSLISNWDEKLFGAKCPFVRQKEEDTGDICVRYNIPNCKSCIFPQLAALAALALPDNVNADDKNQTGSLAKTEVGAQSVENQESSITMKALGGTIMYTIKNEIDPLLTVKVYSVAVGHIVYTPDLDILKRFKSVAEANSDCELLAPPPSQNTPSLSVSAVAYDGVFPAKQVLPAASITDAETESDSVSDSLTPAPLKLPVLVRTVSIIAEPVRHTNRRNKGYNNCASTTISTYSKPERFSQAYGSPTLKGLPVHTIVTFIHMPGSLIVSSLHLNNLLDVKTDTESVIRSMTNILGRERSVELERVLIRAQTEGSDSLRQATAAIVAEITASSTAQDQNSD